MALIGTTRAAGGRHLINKIPVPGDYGWDYLTADSESRRLYVSPDKEGSGELLRLGLRGMPPRGLQ
jgi:hypothetical protein